MIDLSGRLASGDTLYGTFLGLGSALAAEACALAGFDWLLTDLEHGGGDESELLPQQLAADAHGVPMLVRVESTHRIRAGHALDLGAAGVMFPGIESRRMRVLAATKRGYRRRAGSLRAMTLVTAESVHRTPVLDLAACWSEDQRYGLPLGQVRCGGEAPFPPGWTPCAKFGPSRTARRGGSSSWACVRLRRSWTPRPPARHAVHVGSRAIARQAGGTPQGTARPHVHSRLRRTRRPADSARV
jgi:hypothetical protein